MVLISASTLPEASGQNATDRKTKMAVRRLVFISVPYSSQVTDALQLAGFSRHVRQSVHTTGRNEKRPSRTDAPNISGLLIGAGEPASNTPMSRKTPFSCFQLSAMSHS
jgi:hypothetical protein